MDAKFKKVNILRIINWINDFDRCKKTQTHKKK